jgi:hypothetical protein
VETSKKKVTFAEEEVKVKEVEKEDVPEEEEYTDSN